MPSYLITGAGRGLGLEFATQLLNDRQNTVIATARNTAAATGLQELKAKDSDGRLHLVDLDVSKPATIQAAAQEVTRLLPDGLDHLMHNAGMTANSMKTFEEIDTERFMAEMEFTLAGTINLYRSFLPLVRKGQVKKILIISSRLGSIELSGSFPYLEITYAVGKASLNMLTRRWGAALKEEGILTAIVHPGWVGTTGLGSQIADWVAQNAPGMHNVPVDESVAGVLKVLHNLTAEQSGLLLNFDGTRIPF